MIFAAVSLALVLWDLFAGKRRRRIRRGLLKQIEGLGSNRHVRLLHSKPGSRTYKNLKARLKQAGGGMSPEGFQTVTYLLPAAAVILAIAARYTNALNSLAHMDKLRAIAEKVGNPALAHVSMRIGGQEWVLYLAIALIFHRLPYGALKLLISYRNARGYRETVMLQTYTIMMLKAGKSVKQILLSLYERAKVYRAPLEAAVNGYSADPEGTLERLKCETGHPNFEKICIALRQALDSDREVALRYLEGHRMLGKELNRINRRERNARKSIVGVLLMIFPLLAFLMVGGYPWFVYSVKLLDMVPI
ncbi:MAG: hypothetical protein HPY66_2954 [Firmicutes bacterium]|nr:hypothetical protein [Bacillota bacterium]